MSTEKRGRVVTRNSGRKMNVETFVFRAIENLRTKGYNGIHVVFSGFNAAFKEYFPDLNPREETRRLAEEKKIEIRPAKKGVMIYKFGEAPPTRDYKGEKALAAILGKNESTE